MPPAIKILAFAVLAFALYAVFAYPFPAKCTYCSIPYRAAYLIFYVFGLTAFSLPLFLLLFLPGKKEKIKKAFSIYIKIWLPLLVNLALVRDLFEIEARIGGLGYLVFDFAEKRRIDFLFVLLFILLLDLWTLYILGLDIEALFNKFRPNRPSKTPPAPPGEEKGTPKDTQTHRRSREN